MSALLFPAYPPHTEYVCVCRHMSALHLSPYYVSRSGGACLLRGQPTYLHKTSDTHTQTSKCIDRHFDLHFTLRQCTHTHCMCASTPHPHITPHFISTLTHCDLVILQSLQYYTFCFIGNGVMLLLGCQELVRLGCQELVRLVYSSRQAWRELAAPASLKHRCAAN